MARAFFLLLFCMLIFPSPAWALNTGMGSSHYAKEMEFYYQKPRPEILLPMLRNFSSQGVLTQADRQLALGAFLGELARGGKIDLAGIVDKTGDASRNLRRALAWAAHFSGGRNSQNLISRLLDEKDRLLADQIKKSPANLSLWRIDSGKSVLYMYWGAFMATGKASWLESIIDCALQDPNGASRMERNTAREAAATLYENARKHPPVAEALRGRVRKATGRQKEILDLILGGKR